MARHRSDYAGERLTARCDCKIAPSDRQRLDAAAVEMGVAPSDLIRQFIMRGLQGVDAKRPQRTAKKVADASLTARLNRLGTELNGEALRVNLKEPGETYDPVKLARLSGQLVEALQEISRHDGRQAITDERRKLIAAVNWIGNNVQQLARAAAADSDRKTVARLDAIEQQIIAAFERATP